MPEHNSRTLVLKKYNHSEKGKTGRKKYNSSHKGKLSLNKAKHKYRQTENRKRIHNKYSKQWRKTKKGKMMVAKQNAKRKRNLQWIPLFDNPFDESEQIEWHHINDVHVVALPRNLHRLYLNNRHRENTMEIVKQIYLDGD